MSKNNITKKQIPLLIFLTVMFTVIFYSSGITDSIQKFFTRTSDVSTIEIMNEITTLQEAKGKAIESAARFPHKAILIDDQTVERSYGWFFVLGPEQRIPISSKGAAYTLENVLIFVGKDGSVEDRYFGGDIESYIAEYDNDYIHKVLETPIEPEGMIADNAYQKAVQVAREQVVVAEDNMMLWEEKTIEKPYGWFFVFAPEKYIETGEMRYQVPGSPFIFVGKNGETEGFPSSATRSFFVDEYDRMYEAGELDNYLNNL